MVKRAGTQQVEIIAGFCNTAQVVADGRAKSSHTPKALHALCHSTFCVCPCHGVRTPGPAPKVAPVAALTVPVPLPGKRDRKVVEQAVRALRQVGRIEWTVDPAWDEGRITNLRAWLHSVARKAALRITVEVKDGKVVANRKGD